MKILHKHGVIIGDISGKNLLWTDTPSFQVMVIDCDSFRILGEGGVASPKQSPDWDDPHLNGKATSQESDVYKLAVAAFRAIWASGTDRPLAPNYVVPAAPPGIPNEIRELITSSLQPNDRPTADEWEKALAMPAMFRGRPAVKMGTSTGLRPSTPNSSAGTPMGTPRPTLIMKQDDSL
jgi:DNA-binding helix-hairpin-helix protein with protein kinase domain